MDSTIYLKNKQEWKRGKVVSHYYLREKLQKPEEVIISLIKKDILNKSILDIGVGCGRTTAYLKEISSDYIGIDYSSEMIKLCKEKFKDTNFLLCDARNMSIFKEQKFDLVFFFL